MKRIEILCLAYSVSTPGEPWWLDDQDLIKFAALVAAHEREQCAKVCEEGGRDESGRIHVQAWGCAKEIRARSQP
jgi:hypothetical protein